MTTADQQTPDPGSRSDRAEEYERLVLSPGDAGDPTFERENPEAARAIRMLNAVFGPADRSREESPVPADAGHSLPETIGRFKVERLLGQGGMGTVYLAVDPALGRRVAIKVPRSDCATDSESRRRLFREAQAVAQLDHPGIVPVFEVGEAPTGGHAMYLVMAWCDGEDLGRWMEGRNDPVDARLAARIVARVAEAIAHGHSHGILHRDLKPANILLFPPDPTPSDSSIPSPNADTSTGMDTPCHQAVDSGGVLPWTPRVTDFGLARSLDDRLRETGSSMVLGTPLYMSPEQAECRSADVGPGTDVFAVGAILYHLLTGTPPFAADSYPAVLLRLREDTLQPASRLRPDVDRDLDIICGRCLERMPGDRYPSADDVARDLNRYLAGEPIAARPAGLSQRIRQWSEHPSRTRESVAAIISAAVIRIIFALLGLLMIVLVGEVSVTRAEVADVVLAHLCVTIPYDLWTIRAARRLAARRLSRFGFRIAMYSSLIWASSVFLVAANVVPGPLWYQRMPGARVTVFTIIGILFAIQATGWCLAGTPSSGQGGSRRQRFREGVLASGMALMATLLILTIRQWSPLTSSAEAPTGPDQSVLLDGIDDHVAIDPVGFPEAQPMTLEAWLRPDESRKAIAVQFSPVAIGTIAASDGNRAVIHIQVSPERIYEISTDSIIPLGQWAHVALTYDSQRIAVFVNGQPQPTTVFLYDAGNNTMSPAELPDPLRLTEIWPGAAVYLGLNDPSTLNYPFAGRIGEVRLSRSVFYRGPFAPRDTLSSGPDTEFLFHLSDEDGDVADATGSCHGRVRRSAPAGD